jgi:hypothetical protein
MKTPGEVYCVHCSRGPLRAPWRICFECFRVPGRAKLNVEISTSQSEPPNVAEVPAVAESANCHVDMTMEPAPPADPPAMLPSDRLPLLPSITIDYAEPAPSPPVAPAKPKKYGQHDFGKPCNHCRKAPINRPRGLCWKCYYLPGIREKYGGTSPYARRGVGNGNPRLLNPTTPTEALPGTAEKFKVLRQRAAHGEGLWHPLDAKLPAYGRLMD